MWLRKLPAWWLANHVFGERPHPSNRRGTRNACHVVCPDFVPLFLRGSNSCLPSLRAEKDRKELLSHKFLLRF